MSCGLALAVAMVAMPGQAIEPAAPPVAAPVLVAEPLYADIVARAGALKAVVDDWLAQGAADDPGFAARPDFQAFVVDAAALAEADMAGHVDLRQRGTDGDLRCILRGLAEDLPRRVEDVRAAADPRTRRLALDELAYLLNDNVEVVTTPPR